MLTITEENNTEGREAVETLIYITAKLSAVELCGILNNNNNNNNTPHQRARDCQVFMEDGEKRKKRTTRSKRT